MRSPKLCGHLLAALHVALLANPSTLVTAASDLHSHGQITQAKPQFPTLTSIRDKIIDWAWRKEEGPARPDVGKLSRQHESQVILRFNVTTLEEEQALAEAVDIQMKDVLAFTPDYVDILLYKSHTTGVMRSIPESLRNTTTEWVTDVSSAVYASYLGSVHAPKWVPPVQPGYARLEQISHKSQDDFFQNYQPLNVVESWMKLYEAMFPSLLELISVGKSSEGRSILALRAGSKTAAALSKKSRKTLVVTGGLHGREWISTTSVTYLVWSFVTAYGHEGSATITKLLDNFDIIFVPALNPDGVAYTWENDRLWRKTRQDTGFICTGMDLDHAFGYQFNPSGLPFNECSASYGGNKPFEAIEAATFAQWARNEVANNSVNFVGLIDLHSYSQQVLMPYAFSCDAVPPNHENLAELAAGLAKALRRSSGEPYSVASACEGVITGQQRRRGDLKATTGVRIEAAGGSIIDWFYHELGARYSYQIKLRDEGSYGFLLPAHEIVPTGEEVLSMMKYLGDYLLGNNGIEKSIGHETSIGGEGDHILELRDAD